MRGQKKRLQRTVRPLPDEDETIGIDLGQPKPSMPFRQNKPDDEIASAEASLPREDIHQGERNEEVIMERLEPLPARVCPHWSEVIIGFCTVQCVYSLVYTRARWVQRRTHGTWTAPESQLIAFNLNESVL